MLVVPDLGFDHDVDCAEEVWMNCHNIIMPLRILTGLIGLITNLTPKFRSLDFSNDGTLPELRQICHVCVP